MALKKHIAVKTTATLTGPAGPISAQTGTTVFPDAYIRISGAMVTKDTLVVNVSIQREAGGPTLDMRQFELPHSLLSSDNALAQAYAGLKQLPEFADATDT